MTDQYVLGQRIVDGAATDPAAARMSVLATGDLVGAALENLRPKETRAFIDTAFRDGAIQTTGTAIIKVLPPMSRFSASGGHGEKKQRVLTKLSAFFGRFFGLSANGGTDE